ncbi:MAG: helix-turn-helix transcriptional regulator [Desulfatiglandales bacterium]
MQTKKRRIIRKPELLARIGVSDATIWRWEKLGNFPQRVQLGANSVGWFSDEVDEWDDAKASERKGGDR